MKVSVYIPCFNEEKYLGNCLESLVKQTHPPDEVIICDNNSTDNTIKVAQKYQKTLPLKIIHQSIKGIRPTTEAAWRATSGDIIIRTDADAASPPEWISKIVAHFEKDPSLAACGGDSDTLDGSRLMNIIVRVAYFFSDPVFLILYGYTSLFGPNMAIRRQVMENINGYISNDPIMIDDQLISQKLAHHHLKYRRFADCRNLHSTRRYNQKPLEILNVFRILFQPQAYKEKSA
jgi:glycosyltransferase involved in cell wall biosynthesis